MAPVCVSYTSSSVAAIICWLLYWVSVQLAGMIFQTRSGTNGYNEN